MRFSQFVMHVRNGAKEGFHGLVNTLDDLYRKVVLVHSTQALHGVVEAEVVGVLSGGKFLEFRKQRQRLHAHHDTKANMNELAAITRLRPETHRAWRLATATAIAELASVSAIFLSASSIARWPAASADSMARFAAS